MNTVFKQKSLHRPTVAIVDLGKLARNAKRLFQLTGKPSFFCPMVKANGYGHGDLAIAKKLREIGVTHLGVGLIEEALHLRKGGDSGQILHFGMFDEAGARELVDSTITPVLSSIEEVRILIQEIKSRQLKMPFDVHVKINTGMNRLGFEPSLARKAIELILATPHLKLSGVATHFASGELLSEVGSTAYEQLNLFERCVIEFRSLGAIDFVQHIANSATARELHLMARTDFGVRPGLSLYGIELPTALKPKESVFALEAIMRLESCIVHIQDIRQGERVSYGGNWQASRPSKIGVIPIGYADGYHRGLGGGSVLVHGRRAPIVGAICMDYLMVDLTDFQGRAKVGDVVVLMGDEITAVELADRLGSIPYEILTSLSERVPRLYNDEPQSAGVF
jgi:alanine racemase